VKSKYNPSTYSNPFRLDSFLLVAVVIPAEAGIQQPIGKTGFPFPAYYLLGQALNRMVQGKLHRNDRKKWQ